MTVFHHSLAHLGELRAPKELADWLATRNERYPDVTFMVGRLNKNAQQRQDNKETVERYSHAFIGGAVPGIAQVTFLYHGETWSIRIIGDLTLEERNEIAEFPALSEVVLAKPNTYFLKRSPDQPAAEHPAEYVAIRSDRAKQGPR